MKPLDFSHAVREENAGNHLNFQGIYINMVKEDNEDYI